MPANLTAQYLKAEEEYRRATTLDEELACLQVMLQEIPKHKGTDHLQAELKSKITKAKKELPRRRRRARKARGLRIPRQGAGTAILLGGPNAGKSQLVASLTRPPRGGPLSVHHPRPPRHDALGRRDGPTDRHAADHGRLHGVRTCTG